MGATRFHLASASPRRRELLAQFGFAFDCVPADVPEVPQAGESPAAYAQRIALAKAQTVARRLNDGLPVLGADTDVVLDGTILGKPRDRADAIAMLRRLSDRVHEVYSALAIVQGERVAQALSVSEVRFGPIAVEAAAAYWDSGEPAGKAGAYAIQGLGAMFVRELRGSYSGVVGLPLYETVQLLSGFGIKPAHESRPTT